MNQEEFERLKYIVDSFQNKIGTKYDIAFILGSGYDDLIINGEISKKIRYVDIPKFPHNMITGQKGEVLTKYINRKKVIIFCGRFHYYQGYSPFEVTLPVRISKYLGVRIIIMTNAAGGINSNFKSGDIMIIRDHINLMKNPLVGFSVKGYDVFVDMSEPYSLKLRNLAVGIADKLGIKHRFKDGIYLATTGPSYETKAEINFFKKIGADAVGMSTVPEVIVSKQENMEVFALSVITNMATGISTTALNHKDVLETMGKAKEILSPFFDNFIKEL